MSKVGENIRYVRIKQGYSQNALAKKAGIAQATLNAIEATTKSPSVDTISLLASALGVSVSYLMGETDAPQPDETDEVWQLREQLRRDPNTRILFDAAKDAKPEHIKAAAAMLRSLKGEE